MALTRIDTSTDTLLVISQSACIVDVVDFSRHFTEVLGATTPLVTIDLNGIEEVDVSFFQLLLAFNNTLGKRGRHVMVRALPANHVVIQQSTLLGIKFEHYFALVGASE